MVKVGIIEYKRSVLEYLMLSNTLMHSVIQTDASV